LIEFRDEVTVRPEEYFGELYVLTFLRRVERRIVPLHTLEENVQVARTPTVHTVGGMHTYRLVLDRAPEPEERGLVSFWSFWGSNGPIFGVELHLRRIDAKLEWTARVGVIAGEHPYCVKDGVVLHLPRFHTGTPSAPPTTAWERLDRET